MSGPIRQQIGPAKQRLTGYIDASVQRINGRPAADALPAVIDPWLQLLRADLLKINNTLTLLERLLNNWSHLMIQIVAEDLPAEEARFNQAAEGATGVLALLERGRETADLLQITISGAALLLPAQGPAAGAAEHNRPQHAKLEKLKIHIFKGEEKEWPAFWDSFNSAVHARNDVTDDEKLNYLRGRLDGDALKLISSYYMTAANYQLAVTKLEERYGNKEQIIMDLHNELQRLPIAQNTLTSARKVLDDIERVLLQLEQLGERGVNNNNILAAIECRFPRWILIELQKAKVAKVAANEQWDASAARKELEKIISMNEAVAKITRTSAPNFSEKKVDSNPPSQRREGKPQQQSHVRVFTAPGEEAKKKNDQRPTQSRKKLPCLFCTSDQHTSTKCDKFKGIQARTNKLKSLGKCSICLKEQHQGECGQIVRCQNCKSNGHRVFLCPAPQKGKNSLTAAYVANVPEEWSTNVGTWPYSGRHVQNFTAAERQQTKASPLLMTLSTMVLSDDGKQGPLQANILFDPGSQKSFITDKLASSLHLTGPERKVFIHGMFDRRTEITTKTVRAQLLRQNGPKEDRGRDYATVVFQTTPKITGFIPILKKFNKTTNPDGSGYVDTQCDYANVDILIGIDVFWNLVRAISRCPQGYFIIETVLGTVFCGSKAEYSSGPVQAYTIYVEDLPPPKTSPTTQREEEANKTSSPPALVQREEVSEQENWFQQIASEEPPAEMMWKLDVIGITESPEENDDEIAQQLFEKVIEFNGERYVVSWPWRRSATDLPTNFSLCLKRLHSTYTRLCQTPALLEKYHEVFADQLNSQIIEPVPEREMHSALTHYLPHQCVYRADKGKIRIVFDASAHLRGKPSLNDVLYKGPVLLPQIAGVLLRWRMGRIVVCCDIEKAFLTIALKAPDKDVTRFLWLKDHRKPPSKENLQVYRYTRVLFGIVSSPYLLVATVLHHLKKVAAENQDLEELTSEIAANLYMDNIIVLAKTVEEALMKARKIKDIFRSAGMNIQEYLSNDESVNEAIPKKDRLDVSKAKFLGIKWVSDQMVFRIPDAPEGPVTMRSILKTINSLFDPTGLLCPVLLEWKLFFQGLWEHKLKWDDHIQEEKVAEWRAMLKKSAGQTITIQRMAVPGILSERGVHHQLHIFSDASGTSFATAVYLLSEQGGIRSTTLLFAKSRIRPRDQRLTIPRLELLGLLIGCRAGRFVLTELGASITSAGIYAWSDSEAVLHWLSNPEKSVFVENQVKKIRTIANDYHFAFGHVPGEANPADLGTRIRSLPELQQDRLWWDGPSWLRENPSNWPKIWEWKAENPGEDIVLHSITKEECCRIIDTHRFSKYADLQYSAMLVLRSAKIFLQKAKKRPTSKFIQAINCSGRFEAKDYRTADLWLIKEAQSSSTICQKIIHKLNLFQDTDGIWRSKSRLQNSNLPADSIEPILLPNNDRLTTLIVLQAHAQFFHAGVQTTHSVLWRKFCGINKRVIRQLLSACVPCKLRTAAPYTALPFPPYPVSRVQQAPAFSHIGLDYLGPTETSINGQHQKMWILLITCLKSRAVWLDGVLDLTTTTFLNAMRRFISKRGCPSYIISDNATTFTLAHKTLELIWKKAVFDEEVMSFAASKQITWKHITPHAAWEGGIYERLVGIAKEAFKRAIGRKTLPLDQMQTVIAEIEALVNSRPLVDLGEDSTHALRPFDFLQIQGQPGLAPLESENGDQDWLPKMDSASKVIASFRQHESVLNKFWRAWQQDYLTSLRSRRQILHRQGKTASISPKKGELVLVVEDNLPRGQWKLGRIMELVENGANDFRTARVKLTSGNIVSRSIKHLIPLEIGGTNDETTTSSDLATPVPAPSIEPSNAGSAAKLRPQRKAKVKAKQKIEEWTSAVSTPRSNWPFFFLSILSFLTPVMSTFECLPNAATSKVYVEKTCNSKGFILFNITTETGNPSLCYQVISCGPGRFSSKRCSPSLCFKCPPWANGCVQQDYFEMKESNSNSTATRFLSLLHDPAPLETIAQVQLYDGTIHRVRELALQTKDVFEEQAECFGDSFGNTIGSTHYCHIHECAKFGTKFCFYPHHEVTFLTSQYGNIPIKAWGTISSKSASVKSRSRRELASRQKCHACSARCTTRGVHLSIPGGQARLAEICCKPYCHAVENPSVDVEVPFPTDLLLSDHQCSLEVWDKKHQPFEPIVVPSCPAQPICELIDCFWCQTFVLNPHCWPTLVSIFLGVLLGLTLAVLHMICSIACRTLSCLRFIFAILKWPPQTVYRCVKYKKESRNRGRSSRFELPNFVPFSARRTTIALLTMAATTILAVSTTPQFSSFTATEESCTKNSNGQQYQCLIEHSTVLRLQPSNQEATLLIKSPGGKPLGHIKISAKVELQCQKSSQFYSRSVLFRTHSSKRCPKQGSCYGDTCATTTLKSKISELAAVNDVPGNTFCTDSCSWLDCGCALPTPACLFYRTVAIAATTDIFEFFNCPAWQYTANIQIGVQFAQQTQTYNIRLQPGMPPHHLDNMKVVLNSVTAPPLPVLSQKFGISGNNAFIADEINPKFQCPSNETAAKFTEDCVVAPDACQCSITDPTVSCNCVDGRLEKHLQPSPNLLPIRSNEFTLKLDGQQLRSSVPHAVLDLQVITTGLQLSSSFDNVSCSISIHQISGCYNCLAGAVLKYRCETENDATTTAHVTCTSGEMFTLACGRREEETLRLSLDKAQIDTVCEASCPAGITSFQLKGELAYVAQMTIPERLSQRTTYQKNEIDFKYLFGFFINFYSLPIIILSIITVIVIIICLTTINPFSMFVRLFRPQCRASRHDKLI